MQPQTLAVPAELATQLQVPPAPAAHELAAHLFEEQAIDDVPSALQLAAEKEGSHGSPDTAVVVSHVTLLVVVEIEHPDGPVQLESATNLPAEHASTVLWATSQAKLVPGQASPTSAIVSSQVEVPLPVTQPAGPLQGVETYTLLTHCNCAVVPLHVPEPSVVQASPAFGVPPHATRTNNPSANTVALRFMAAPSQIG